MRTPVAPVPKYCKPLAEKVPAVPLAITLMIVVSKCTRREVPADARLKMLVLHAPEKLGLKQEYVQEHEVVKL